MEVLLNNIHCSSNLPQYFNLGNNKVKITAVIYSSIVI
jgi:hypothetical protein